MYVCTYVCLYVAYSSVNNIQKHIHVYIYIYVYVCAAPPPPLMYPLFVLESCGIVASGI